MEETKKRLTPTEKKELDERKRSIEFNNLMMKEMGFDAIGRKRKLIDQDTNQMMQFDGKFLVQPGSNVEDKALIEFDPYNSSKIMNQMFNYYTQKLTDQGEIPDYQVLYNVDGKDGKGRIELKGDGEKLVSGEYVRDQCRYADIILQISGEENPEEILKPYDIPKSVTDPLHYGRKEREYKTKYLDKENAVVRRKRNASGGIKPKAKRNSK